MSKHALPRTLFRMLSEDRRRGGRGQTKHAADQVMLEVYEQLNADHESVFGKRLSVRQFLKLQMIDQAVSGGVARAKAEALLDHPSVGDRVRFEAGVKTLRNRLSAARKRRHEQQMKKQAAWSRALRSR